MYNYIHRLCFVVALIVFVLAWTPALAQLSPSDIQDLQNEIAANGYHFTVSQNPATQLSIDQLCGLRPPSNWQSSARYETRIMSPLGSSLPSSFDWRSQNAVTPVRNQGSCGACWAFATVGPVEADIMRATGIAVDLSEQWLISCNPWRSSCNGGWWAIESVR